LGFIPFSIKNIFNNNTKNEVFVSVVYIEIGNKVSFSTNAIVFICRAIFYKSGASPFEENIESTNCKIW
jgi:hypothetical protein